MCSPPPAPSMHMNHDDPELRSVSTVAASPAAKPPDQRSLTRPACALVVPPDPIARCWNARPDRSRQCWAELCLPQQLPNFSLMAWVVTAGTRRGHGPHAYALSGPSRELRSRTRTPAAGSGVIGLESLP